MLSKQFTVPRCFYSCTYTLSCIITFVVKGGRMNIFFPISIYMCSSVLLQDLFYHYCNRFDDSKRPIPIKQQQRRATSTNISRPDSVQRARRWIETPPTAPIASTALTRKILKRSSPSGTVDVVCCVEHMSATKCCSQVCPGFVCADEVAWSQQEQAVAEDIAVKVLVVCDRVFRDEGCHYFFIFC